MQTIILTQQGEKAEYKHNDEILPAHQDGPLGGGLGAVTAGPERAALAAELAPVAEVDALAAVLAEPGVLALVLVNALRRSQPPLPHRATTSKTQN